MTEQEYDVIIIGGGPAGLTASIYTGRAQLKTLILEGGTLGGNTALTDHIDNYPGFPFGITGPELTDHMWRQAQRFGVELAWEQVVGLEDLGEYKKVMTSGHTYMAKAVIVAAGVKRRELGVAAEGDYLGRGLSYCATCDGAFFQNVPVAVVGGGDSAVKEALYLAGIASKVYLIHWMDEFQANPNDVNKSANESKIAIMKNRTVNEIKGEGLLQSLVLQNTITQEKEELVVEGLFVSIGMIPSGGFYEDFLNNDDGYIRTKNDISLETSVAGIFAAGDIRVKKIRQVATAVGDGAIAGMAAVEYLK